LQATAKALRLHEQKGWSALLHMAPRVGGIGQQTDVKTEWFFLSGTHDAEAELEATLAAFFSPAPLQPRDEPARCQFSARFAWLADHLPLEEADLPDVQCDRRDQWLKALAPERIWLVFPAAYLNSPASMFGHTLLRVDNRESGTGSDGRALLAYAINYAAETEESNGLIFAFKGLTGGYDGSFSVMPYYEKVRDYARIENRDIWEYPLDLDDEQMNRLLLHVWELRGVKFDYYFFHRNCAYQLQALLQTVEADVDLLEGFRWRAIPTDTIRRLAEGQTVSAPPKFRPAMATRLRTRSALLPDDSLKTARAIALGNVDAEAPGTKFDPLTAARTLDVAHDLIYYRYQSGVEDREPALRRARRVLGARAELGSRSSFPDPEPPATAPSDGHPTMRFGMGVYADERAAGPRLRWRPAYHDLLDPQDGYDAGAELAFFDVALAGDTRNGGVTLDHLWLVDIVSATPPNIISSPIGWHARFGGLRRFSVVAPFELTVETGGGRVFGSMDSFGAAFFLDTELSSTRQESHGHRVGLGAQVRVFWEPISDLRGEISWQIRETVSGDTLDWQRGRARAHWQLSPVFGLRVGVDRNRINRTALETRGTVDLLHYF